MILAGAIAGAGSSPVLVEYLVIAGGGAGYWNSGRSGGGGAGGYRSSVAGELSGARSAALSPLVALPDVGINVTVGAGGSSSNGSNSVFGTITSIGGGHGGWNWNVPGQPGGSGGGGHYEDWLGDGYGSPHGYFGLGTAGQGTNGAKGNINYDSGFNSGGGGGGAGYAAVQPGNGNNGGNGGDGLPSSITGTEVYRAGGGGGTSFFAGGGGLGGGGNGGGQNGSATPGQVNTGSGGGGKTASGTGGSGVVILRYPANRSITLGAGLVGSTTTVGANKVTTITAGTGNVSFA